MPLRPHPKQPPPRNPPQEVAADATCHSLRSGHLDVLPGHLEVLPGGGGGAAPVGPPLPGHFEVMILDGGRRAVPPGEEGEVWVAGPGVALGYLNDPSLTRDRRADVPILQPLNPSPSALS